MTRSTRSLGGALLLATASVLMGCATTPGGMRSDVSAKRVFIVPVGYQLVLKRLNDHWAECSASPMLPLGQMINDVQHYPDMRMASIVRGSSGIGTQIVQVIDIREASAGATEVTTYSKSVPDKLAEITKRSAEGDLSCKV